MNRSTLVLAASLTAPLLAASPGDQVLNPIQSERLEPCPNAIRHEPVLLFETSGSTLLGSVHRSVIVYNDGSAVAVLNNQIWSGSTPANGQAIAINDPGSAEVETQVASASLSQGQVNVLLAMLEEAGAFDLCDQEMIVMDAPLHTVTVLTGEPQGAARTFSYWIPTPQYAGVNAVLQSTLKLHFPAFFDGI